MMAFKIRLTMFLVLFVPLGGSYPPDFQPWTENFLTGKVKLIDSANSSNNH